MFDRAREAHGGQTFLDFSGDEYTYADIAHRSAQVSNLLLSLGIGHGDTVVTVLDNNVDAVSTFLGSNRIGAICVPVNTAYRGEFLRHQLADAGAAVVFAEPDYAQRVLEIADGVPALRTLIYRDGTDAMPPSRAGLAVRGLAEALDGQSSIAPNAPVAATDLSTLIYTAGTTGPSKGCMITHAYTLNMARQYLEVTTRRRDELAWTPLPLFHFNAWACTVVATALLGSSAAVAPRFSVSRFWSEIERTGARMVTLLGPMVTLLAQADDSSAMQRCYGQLRIAQSSPFPADITNVWRERFGVPLTGSNAFGLTECCLTTHHPLNEPAPAGSSGRANDDFDVRIFDDEDREVPVGAAGEIVVRPKKPHVMFEGYWKRPESTTALLRNLWFHTGDIGRFDADGFFYFVDRKKDYLRRRGENISSYEMETAFMSHPDLLEVAVHAVHSAVTEDDVKVTAVLRPGSTLSEEALCAWSMDKLPYFAVPRYIEFRAELPKNPVGRVLKYVLRDEGKTASTWDREAAGIAIAKR
ncbi:AMP-binding protein [Mycobacterium saskatchewanense]|uniref:AMP-binding protein n=1 Tax=Mycobacterium saskatchewanense TaxID=220927 RepID=UPI0018D79755|nr:AMP-binding protein [Mycobacterium saskatchewanense]